jgi:hypothetical protein
MGRLSRFSIEHIFLQFNGNSIALLASSRPAFLAPERQAEGAIRKLLGEFEERVGEIPTRRSRSRDVK